MVQRLRKSGWIAPVSTENRVVYYAERDLHRALSRVQSQGYLLSGRVEACLFPLGQKCASARSRTRSPISSSITFSERERAFFLRTDRVQAGNGKRNGPPFFYVTHLNENAET